MVFCVFCIFCILCADGLGFFFPHNDRAGDHGWELSTPRNSFNSSLKVNDANQLWHCSCLGELLYSVPYPFNNSFWNVPTIWETKSGTCWSPWSARLEYYSRLHLSLPDYRSYVTQGCHRGSNEVNLRADTQWCYSVAPEVLLYVIEYCDLDTNTARINGINDIYSLVVRAEKIKVGYIKRFIVFSWWGPIGGCSCAI